MIYLDNAATSFYRPETVARAVAEAINTMGNCSRGTYETALTSARTVYETRDLLSGLFHGDGPEQVAFTANSTESLNIAIKGVLAPGDRVVTTALNITACCALFMRWSARAWIWWWLGVPGKWTLMGEMKRKGIRVRWITMP